MPQLSDLPTIAHNEEPTIHYFATLEETSLSIWLRESGFAFFSSLTLHSLAMAVVVGINIAVNLQLLGVGGGKHLHRLVPLYRLHWLGALLVLLSGIALLLAYPAKALTNPVFYFKLTALSCGLLIARSVQLQLQSSDQGLAQMGLSSLAAWSLLMWLLAITAGRFLAYTYTILLASRFY
ncbi:MAG: hypothetical protein RL120_15010 [Gammaproteobacteria bacterium]